MCRGPVLRITEVKRAAELRSKLRRDGKKLSWRKIGRILGRDHSGLRRMVEQQRLLALSTNAAVYSDR